MIGEEIAFMPGELFVSRSPLLVLERLKGQVKMGGISNAVEKNKASNIGLRFIKRIIVQKIALFQL